MDIGMVPLRIHTKNLCQLPIVFLTTPLGSPSHSFHWQVLKLENAYIMDLSVRCNVFIQHFCHILELFLSFF